MLKYIVKRISLDDTCACVHDHNRFSIFLLCSRRSGFHGLQGPNVTPEVYESIKRKYGLDQPYIVQYWRFMKSVIEGDLGISILQERPVIEMIKERLPVTLEIGLLGFLITFVIAIPAGVIAAVKKNTFVDYLCMSGTLLGVAIPTFWFGMLLMYFFAYKAEVVSHIGLWNHKTSYSAQLCHRADQCGYNGEDGKIQYA
jgi:ABC-type dipeptide/oligopeptide/nickel transport system permease component